MTEKDMFTQSFQPVIDSSQKFLNKHFGIILLILTLLLLLA